MRVHGFDVLRGLCAIGVATYHVLGWLDAAHPYNLGLYGVYVFFVLSGASLWIAYADKLDRGYPLAGFYTARFFRLAPLFWLAVVLTPIILKSGWSWPSLALNLSFLFGVANPGQTSIPTGGWSLGIEFVFYLLFPVLAVAVRSPPALAAGVVLYLAQMAFIGLQVQGPGDLGRNWAAYTQPLAFAFYFYAGMLLGRWLLERPPRPSVAQGVLFIVLAAAIALTSGDAIDDSLTGWRRWLLPLASCALVLSAAHAFARETRVTALLARWLGNASYGVYLLHPLVYAKLLKSNTVTAFAKAYPVVFLAIVLAITIGLALLVERWLERPVRAYGKRLFPWPAQAGTRLPEPRPATQS